MREESNIAHRHGKHRMPVAEAAADRIIAREKGADHCCPIYSLPLRGRVGESEARGRGSKK